MSDTSARLDSVVITLGTDRYLSPGGTEEFGGGGGRGDRWIFRMTEGRISYN